MFQIIKVPVQSELIDKLDLVFDLRGKLADRYQRIKPLWKFDRSTGYRTVKKIMAAAGIVGPRLRLKSCVMVRYRNA